MDKMTSTKVGNKRERGQERERYVCLHGSDKTKTFTVFDGDREVVLEVFD